jgi:hypothetical protein
VVVKTSVLRTFLRTFKMIVRRQKTILPHQLMLSWTVPVLYDGLRDLALDANNGNKTNSNHRSLL